MFVQQPCRCLQAFTPNKNNNNNNDVTQMIRLVDVVYGSNKSAEQSSECHQTFTSADGLSIKSEL